MWEPRGVILEIDSLPWWLFDLVAQRKLHGCRDLLLCQISAGCRVMGSSPSFTFFREKEGKGEMLLGLGLFKEPLSTCKSSWRNEPWSWLCGRWVWSSQKAPHSKAVPVSGQRVERLLEVLVLRRGPGSSLWSTCLLDHRWGHPQGLKRSWATQLQCCRHASFCSNNLKARLSSPVAYLNVCIGSE